MHHQPKEVFSQLRNQFITEPLSLPVERKRILNKLLGWIKQNESSILEALGKDLGRPEEESQVVEILSLKYEINHAVSHLRDWMRVEKVSTPWFLPLSSGKTVYEPKGVCLILSPWNFPFLLAVSPLVSALAAGNFVVVKPSEFAPATALLMSRLCREVFNQKTVICLEGDSDLASALTALPFDHIFFTGSPEIGKKVMCSAAENLSSVTLELGGCNPAVVDETARLKTTAHRIAHGKYLNNGQSCVAPNALYVHEKVYDRFVNLLVEACEMLEKYPRRMVNDRHLKRIRDLEQKSVEAGASWILEPKSDDATGNRSIGILSCQADNPIIREEIFGPLLVVVKYTDFDHLLTNLKKNPKPLAAYLFSTSKKHIFRFEKELSCGTVCINETAMQVAYPGLPFGGVNSSGIGKSKGKYGFLEFSNAKAVVRQSNLFSPLFFLRAPFTRFRMVILKLLR